MVARVTVFIVRLGSPRRPGEGLRLGTVRRPPRGVPKADFSRRDFYDVWLPQLAPSVTLLEQWKDISDARQLAAFKRLFRSEMRLPDVARLLDLLAGLSRQTNFSLGCYCPDEARCHRSVLRELLIERSADVDDPDH